MRSAALLPALVALLAVTPAASGAAAANPSAPPARLEGLTIDQWHQRAVTNRRTINRLRRVLLHRPAVGEAINLAAATYGNGSALWRKARCETAGTMSPRAYNGVSGAAGLFQFLDSTWNSTPYGGFSIWSPYANALAAGWMHAHGRGGEWVCP